MVSMHCSSTQGDKRGMGGASPVRRLGVQIRPSLTISPDGAGGADVLDH